MLKNSDENRFLTNPIRCLGNTRLGWAKKTRMIKKILTGILFLGTIIAFLIGGFSCNPTGGVIALHAQKHDDSLLAQIQNRGKLIAITSYNSTNYFIHQGDALGYQYELLHSLADNLGVNLDIIVENDIDKAVELLQSGKADIIARDLTVTTERSKLLSFSDPIHQTRQVLVQRKPANWRKMTDDEIDQQMLRNPKQLKDRTIFVQKGTSYVDNLYAFRKATGVNFKIEEDPDHDAEDLIASVSHKDVDYSICDEQLATINASLYKNIDIKTAVSDPQNIAWAVRKGSNSLLDGVNIWLREFKRSAQATMLYDKYYKNPQSIQIAQKQPIHKYRNILTPFDHLIKRYSKKIGWDWRLLASLIYEESHFQPGIVSWDGAMGLMQLTPATARKLGVSKKSSIATQLAAGTHYLKQLSDKFSHNVKDKEERNKFVIASYNIGIAHVFDARRLAEKYDKNPNLWSNNVDYYLRNKSKPEFYRDSLARNGFAKGDRTCDYVNRVYSRYYTYLGKTGH